MEACPASSPGCTGEPGSGNLSESIGSDLRLSWLLLLFVGSGCAALIYEVVWLQLLQLVIGLTSVSLGILLATFMGGMCLGSLLLPRLVGAERHPLRVYAFLELGIGAFGLIILFAVPELARIYAALGGSGLQGMLVRGALAAVCLLPPTLFMGATLPAVARWVQTTPQGISWLGFFYGANIVGAVGGCLWAGFYLLRVYDMATATYVAVFINLAIALVGLALASRSQNRKAGLTSPVSRVPLPKGAWAVYAAIALSGMSALGAEVVWTRLMSLILGGTVYTFSIILAVFLVGLGIGSTVGSALARSTTRPRQALAGCQILLMGAVAWTALMIAGSIPYWPVNPALSESPWFTFQLDCVRCLWAILPAACLWGASFPLALAGVAAPQQDPGRLVGGVYAANTVGAIIGALIFSLLVIPVLGTHGAERLLVALPALAAGLLLLAPNQNVQPAVQLHAGLGRVRRFVVAGGVVLAAVFLAWGMSPAPWGLIAYGRYMATYAGRLAPGITAEKDIRWDQPTPNIYCTYAGEGLNGSVAVTQWTSGVRNFHSAGKVQASTDSRDMRLQRMLGHLSALVHQGPKSVLVVACGAGVTAGTFVLHPTVERIVICDIEPLVPQRVAPWFEKENYAVVQDPRTEVVCDDGRHFIRTTKEKFDIITSDPIDPWVKGCAALNTVDYYEMCKAHLKPGGVMSLWIPLYESNLATTKSILATFFKVFSNGILWSNDSEGEGYDAVLFGQVEPTRIDLDALHERVERPDHARVKESLREAEFRSMFGLFSTYAGQASDLQNWLRDAQINTDRNLRLQYLAGMWLNSYQGAEILSEIRRHRRFPEQLFTGSDSRVKALRLAIGGLQTNGTAALQPASPQPESGSSTPQ